MHTEDEARKLWCPMARVRSFRQDGDPAYVTKTCYANGENRGVPNGSANCIASACMMWQWDKDFHVKTRLCSDAFATTEPASPADLPADWYFVPASISLISPAQWAEPTNQSLKRRTGYCGLGGKP